MIIIEGPDGGGKSTLLANLCKDLNLPAHPRSVNSDGSPTTELDKWQWAVNDVNSWGSQELAIYDRHPMISEFIYGPIVRGTLPLEFMSHHVGPLIQKMARNSLLVFCLPAYETTQANVFKSENQMTGVRENLGSIYYSYQARQSTWPGWSLVYNYEVTMGKGSYITILRAAKLHMATFRRDQGA